jgi:phage-related protein
MKGLQRVPRRLIAKFYRGADGRQPVEDYILQQRPAVRLSINRQIDRVNMLDDRNPHLAFPHSSQIEGELRELRCHHGRQLYRILYRRSEQFILLLHIVEKHGALIPEEEKQIARMRWADFRKRIDAELRTQPSPIGKRAPRQRP